MLMWTASRVFDRLQSSLCVAEPTLSQRDHRSSPVRVRQREFQIERVNVVEEESQVRLRFLVVTAERERIRNGVGERRSCSGIVHQRKAMKALLESQRQP